MKIDFTPYFQQYEELVRAADSVFARMEKDYPQCVKCEVGCSECCYALFDLSLIEAIYLNRKLDEKFGQSPEKAGLIEIANQTDRQIYRIKKKAYQRLESKTEEEILAELAEERIRCPLLNRKNQCDLYEYRPVTCRFYGVPTAIGGKGHTCGKSGFETGKTYPTVDLEKIQSRLFQISSRFVQDIESRHTRMADILMPVSMVILTVFDDAYLGIDNPTKPELKTENGK